MEKSVEEGSVAAAAIATSLARPKLLRYALRSGTKSREEKPETTSANMSAPRSVRGRSTSTVSKSLGVLDLSAKEKSAKPPSRRMSIPTKPAVNSSSRPIGSVTPISEAGSRRSLRIETPIGELARSSARQKALLSSTTYWLSQIKISESAAEHLVSLGFFKLAVEAGCKPAPKMREELKSYVKRHDLAQSGCELKLEELFKSYNISESLKKLQIDEPSSLVIDEAMRSSTDEDSRSSSSVAAARKLKPKSLNTKVESAKDNGTNKPASRVGESVPKNSAKARPGGVSNAKKSQNRNTKPIKQEVVKGKDKQDRRGNKPKIEEGQDQTSAAGNPTEDKENATI